MKRPYFIVAGIVILAIIGGIGWYVLRGGNTPTDSSSSPQSDDSHYSFGATLQDVKKIGASGIVQTDYKNGVFKLVAAYAQVPEPKSGYLYRGWLLKSDRSDPVPTGEIQKINGFYSDLFTVNHDLSDHPIYILTLQKESDSDPPAEPMLEGTLTKQ